MKSVFSHLINKASRYRLLVSTSNYLTISHPYFGKSLIVGSLFVLFSGADASAQTKSIEATPTQTSAKTDSTRVINQDVPTSTRNEHPVIPDNDTNRGLRQQPDSTRSVDEAQTPLSNTTPLFPQAYPADLQPFTVSIPTDGRIALWRSGGIFGDMGQMSLPGLMGVESGSLFLVQQAGRFTFTAHGDAVKYGYFGGLQTSYGFGGSISYDFSDRIGVTIFGSYYTPLHRGMTPAMQGYTSIPNFGGYVNYRFSDHWGVKVGGQAFRSSVSNRMEAQPIVIPYYRLSKNAELGIDVGGILYNIVKKNRNGSMGGSMNPTIPPPVMDPPPVR